MSKDTAQEKTEQATPHRLQKALDEGKVAKSQELSSVAVISLGFMALYALGPALVERAMTTMKFVFSEAPTIMMSQSAFVGFFKDTVASFFLTIGPFMVAMLVIGALVNVAQVGFRFTTKPLEPKLDKLNPIEGFKRIFKAKTLVEFVRDIFKVILIMGLAFSIISSDVSNFLLLMDVSTSQFAKEFGLLALLLAIKISGVMLVLAIFDFAYQRYNYKKELRMTKQEIKEESKNTEGNPEIKSRIRQVQRDTSRRRMMDAVPTADVVVTNPTHIAVALKYDKETMEAPTVVAKGERLIAQKIKELARAAGVPVIENKPLARSLFELCEIGMSIPDDLYRAVAETLAHVYQLQNKEV